jgi:hypothetical protein
LIVSTITHAIADNTQDLPQHYQERPMPDTQPDDRPKNREVENEMIAPPQHDGKPPRPATQPNGAAPGAGESEAANAEPSF